MGKKTGGNSRKNTTRKEPKKPPKEKEEQEEIPDFTNGEVGDEDEEDKIVAVVEDCVDKINEKRCSTRERGLGTLARLLRRVYCESALEKRKQGLTSALVKSVSKGASEQETKLALQCLTLATFTLGSDSAETLFIEQEEMLTKIINDSDNPKEVRAEAVVCLASLAFIGCPDNEHLNQLAQSFASFFGTGKLGGSLSLSGNGISASYDEFEEYDEDYYDKDGEEEEEDDELPSVGLKERALGAWTAILCLLSDQYVTEDILPLNLGPLQDLLRDSEVRVRAAAGEAIALLFEKARNFHDESFDLRLFDDYLDEGVQSLLRDMQDLAQLNDRRTAKKAKVEQRRLFKEYFSVVSTGACDAEGITIQHQKFYFETFEEQVMLRFCRDVLASGFQAHFCHNDLLQQIFDVTINRTFKKKTMNDQEKRFFMSKNSVVSKTWTRNRKKERRVRSNQKALAFGDDDQPLNGSVE
eukprot:CAMPEP_0201490930 /NCGR_PEP_ID=MMETSP0151_2-20130828/27975_1 /ASSEMBLY_ACC=CAM_ASM_000257 /TAXON_ID=200890 /ORGANISM="Paramoeba atlantica, Strain 621/1 / CCAP 1560/9" /LENGTH=468 /DNA_ID=CAMNT_0047877075 /DNA_START=85 /DNA_END=1491 /DNA_ORIENTATION=+